MSTRTPTPNRQGQRPRSGEPKATRSRRPFGRLRDARIRSKLGLILVVPVVAILGLASLRLVDSGRRALDADLIGSLTSLSADVSGLSHELHRERMAGATFLANQAATPEAFNLQAKRTDDLVARYTRGRQALGGVPEGVADRLRSIDEKIATLNQTRQEVLARQGASVSQVVLRYAVVITDLVSYREEIGQVAGDDALADELRATAAFSKAKAQASEEQAVAYAALKSGQAGGVLDDEQFASFLATLTGQQEALVAFSLAANDLQRALVNTTVTGDAVELADRMAGELTRSVGARPRVTAEDVSSAVGAVTDLMRWTEERLDAAAVTGAAALRAAVLRQVIIESGIVLTTLVLVVAFALLLARSMARSLGRLREGALAVAHQELPAAVARLRDVQTLGENSPDEIARQVRDPIALTSRDEIGQVGQAFNVVHREAVRVAAEQAALRTSVSAMFLNLARRSQTLVDRMIGELDQIERGEVDPKRLGQLFQLDHLATRMRRNDENLLVLAGADSSPPRRDDALLVDALRAAQSEVELYDRVEFGTVDSDVSIASHAVNDAVRLLAELLDNATRFSPPNTIVLADARRIGDYVLVQVEDHGLGLSDEQMQSLNERLAAPSTVDVAAFRMMGLAVVARLASRYAIRVELRRNAEGGTVANVALPASILVLPRIRGREPLIARPRPLAVEPPPGWSPSGWSAVPAGSPNGATPPAGIDWNAPGGMDGRPRRPPVAVGFHVTGAAASSAAAAAAMSMPVAGMPPADMSVAGPPGAGPAGVGPPGAGPPGAGPPGGGPLAGGPPVAGLPYAGPAAQASSPPMSAPPASGARFDDTTELPIFREIEAAWFRTHGPLSTDGWSSPAAPASAPPMTAAPMSGPPSPMSAPPSPASAVSGAGVYAPPPATGYTPPPATGYTPPPATGYTPPPAYVPPPVPSDAGAHDGAVPRPRDPSYDWRTAADQGWQAASAAAEPEFAGTTRSGLPKRRPMGQLVPGGVEQATAQSRAKRTPEEVRGLLSAYHRGVQRGRSGGDLSKAVEPESYKGTNG